MKVEHLIKETNRRIEVMQAFVDGKPIQFKSSRGTWLNALTPTWDWDNINYRVKEDHYIICGNLDEDVTNMVDGYFTGLDKARELAKIHGLSVYKLVKVCG